MQDRKIINFNRLEHATVFKFPFIYFYNLVLNAYYDCQSVSTTLLVLFVNSGTYKVYPLNSFKIEKPDDGS